MVPMSLTPLEKGLDLVERDGHASFELVAERLAGSAQDDPVAVEQHVAAVVERAGVAGAALDELEALASGHPANPVLTHLVGHLEGLVSDAGRDAETYARTCGRSSLSFRKSPGKTRDS